MGDCTSVYWFIAKDKIYDEETYAGSSHIGIHV